MLRKYAMKFTKYHALGNDYIVLDPKDWDRELSSDEIKTICDRHYGLGSDGILFGPLTSASCDFKLRIFNPDGGEAEKSGNGLRIFCRYLWDRELVGLARFSVETKGGNVSARVHADGKQVTVDMGHVRYNHDNKKDTSLQKELIQVLGKTLEGYRANVGNPHFVIPVDDFIPDMAHTYGPAIENDSRFENRTNVQFLKVLDRHNIQIEIWERGAGYTLASGSSSTAAAGVAVGLGLCEQNVKVTMPGGILDISVDPKMFATMKGAVCKIALGELVAEALVG